MLITCRSQSMTAAPGWYPDPGGPGQLRYWDGQAWTSSTATAEPSAPSQEPTYVQQPSYAQQPTYVQQPACDG
jgi:hypothetical protein